VLLTVAEVESGKRTLSTVSKRIFQGRLVLLGHCLVLRQGHNVLSWEMGVCWAAWNVVQPQR
jgi:hypothetical protein